jgi:Glycosyltransferase family 92
MPPSPSQSASARDAQVKVSNAPHAGRKTNLREASADWYLCAAAIFKNEAPYLDEWLAFCVLEGVEHVLLYDNCSTDNSRKVLEPWVAAGIVEVLDWPVPWKDGAQAKAYIDALRRLRGRTRWAAFIDIDEYLFSPTGEILPDVLRRYEEHAGVIVNWQCYGTSGHKARPAGLTIESYTRRARTHWARNRRVKTIVDPSMAVEPWSVHLFTVQPGHALVTEDFKPVQVVRTKNGRRRLRHFAAWLPYLPFDPYSVVRPSKEQVSVSDLRINHYVTRSREELALKYKDRDTMLRRDRRSHSRYHDRNEVEDPVLASKAEKVREIIDRVRGADALLLSACAAE